MAPPDVNRRFATILFTDIVGSTLIAGELGDERWRALVGRHHGIVRRELQRFEGREVDTAGDGFFAIFDSAGAAIRCASAITTGVREVGLEVRAGLHAGEVEVGDAGKAGGIAVNTGARVMSVAEPGEVLVSSTLREVVAGSSLGFEDHGVHHLKGIEGEWRLYRLTTVDGAPREEPLDADEASRRRLGFEPAAPPPRRRALRVFLGALIPAAIIGVRLFALFGDDPTPEGPPAGVGATAGPPPNAIAKLDTRTGDVLLVRNVPAAGSSPFGQDDIEAGLGSVWLARPRNNYRIDPSDGSNTTVKIPSAQATQDLDVGLGAVWVIGPWLYRVDPATGESIERIGLPVPQDRQVFFGGVSVGSQDVWVATRGPYAIRVDPDTSDTELIPLGGDQLSTPEVVAAGEELIWFLDESSGVVWRIDQASGEVLEPIPLSGGLDRLAIGEGFVWVLDTANGLLTPIDEPTGATRPAIPVGEDASDVVFGLGSVWVAEGGRVLEIDPHTFQVIDTIEVGDTPVIRLTVDEEDAALWLDMAPAG